MNRVYKNYPTMTRVVVDAGTLLNINKCSCGFSDVGNGDKYFHCLLRLMQVNKRKITKHKRGRRPTVIKLKFWVRSDYTVMQL